jgi:peptidyl-tRNA hydrolase
MGKGKIVGQVAHAPVQVTEFIRRCPEWYYSWLDDDSLQTKIILKVDSKAYKPSYGLYHATLLLRELTPQKYMMRVRRSCNLSTFTALGIGLRVTGTSGIYVDLSYSDTL